MLWVSAALLVLSSVAAAGLSPGAYSKAVDLVGKLYLDAEHVNAQQLLDAAAKGVGEDIHWLVVESAGERVYLRHGDGTAIGSVGVGSMETLPDALMKLEDLVLGAGFPVGGVDVRLSVLRGMTGALDRNSRILAGDQRWRFNLRLKGEHIGVGVEFHLEGGKLVVGDLRPEGPADLAGVEIDDVVLRIDGRSTVNMPHDEATRLVQGGDEGSQVVLTVRRGSPGRTTEIAVTRAKVVAANVDWKVLDDGVGYVRITHISQRTEQNLRWALSRLRAKEALARGLVIDLRGNTGGSMRQAAKAANEFVSKGLLLRTEGADGGHVRNLEGQMDADRSGLVDVPVVVVVDERTASGSEIMAGALLELERAALVGTRTYGKGTVQKIYNLDDDVQLKLTVAQYVLENERVITDVGLVPDVVVGQIRLDGYGVRFLDFDEVFQRTRWEEILPEVFEEEGWRGRVVEAADLPVELARRAVLGAVGGRRDAVLASLAQVADAARLEQQAHLASALEHHDIDWKRAASESPSMKAHVTVDATPENPDERADVYAVKVEVENLGDAPIAQALVELECPTFPRWDGIVVPVGFVQPGARARGEVAVPLRPGVLPREDIVTVRLRADRTPPVVVGHEVLEAHSSPTPRVSVSARLVPHDDVHRAEVTVRNLANHLITGLDVSFGYPGDLDVELMDTAAVIPVLAGRGDHRVDLAIRVGDGAPAKLPLEVWVQAERYGTLARWPLELAQDGTEVTLREPEIESRGLPLSAPMGVFELPLVVQDDGVLDHVVVFANGAKVAWAPGGRNRAVLATPVELRRGVNLIHVVAEDDQGVRGRVTYAVRGDDHPATVDAGE